MLLDKLPVLAFSSARLAETLELLQRLLPGLAGQGLKVALVRGERAEPAALTRQLLALCRCHDLVLVAGGEGVPLTRVLLAEPGAEVADPTAWALVLPLVPPAERLLLAFLSQWLVERWRQTPLHGCVLIGGQSRRMGRPKHLIRHEGRSWLERTVALLAGVVAQVVVVGAGELPDQALERIPDLPGTVGPLAGLAAAMRWRPWASWLVLACDLPELNRAALTWLANSRRPGLWAAIPRVQADFVEPLFAYYDFRCQGAVEELVRQGERRIGLLAKAEKVEVVIPPAELWPAWRNVNYAHQLSR